MATDSGDNEEDDDHDDRARPLASKRVDSWVRFFHIVFTTCMFGSGEEAPPGRPKSEDLPLKTLGAGGETPPRRPKK